MQPAGNIFAQSQAQQSANEPIFVFDAARHSETTKLRTKLQQTVTRLHDTTEKLTRYGDAQHSICPKFAPAGHDCCTMS